MSLMSDSDDFSMSYEQTNTSLQSTAENRCNAVQPLLRKSQVCSEDLSMSDSEDQSMSFRSESADFQCHMRKLIKVSKPLQRTDAMQNNHNQQEVRFAQKIYQCQTQTIYQFFDVI